MHHVTSMTRARDGDPGRRNRCRRAGWRQAAVIRGRSAKDQVKLGTRGQQGRQTAPTQLAPRLAPEDQKGIPDQDPKPLLTCYAMVGMAGFKPATLDPRARAG
jgi:hypothetical protein